MLGKKPVNTDTSIERKKSLGLFRFGLPVETGVFAVLLVAIGWQIIAFPEFRNWNNLSAALVSKADIAIIAAGMTLVIATGGIDISVGSILGLCGMSLGYFSIQCHWGIAAACLATVIVGALCGLINGILIAYWKLPSIIATLAGLSAARAGAYVIYNEMNGYYMAHGQTMIPPLADAYSNFALGSWLGLPNPVWVAIAVFVVMGVLMKKTAFGRSVLALGGNRKAAFLSGLSTPRIEMMVYVISGITAAIAAIITTASSTPTQDAGKNYELSAITAVVMGGTPIAGGAATMIGSVFGMLTISAIQKTVTSYGMSGLWEQLTLGIALLLSVEVDRWRRTRASKGVSTTRSKGSVTASESKG